MFSHPRRFFQSGTRANVANHLVGLIVSGTVSTVAILGLQSTTTNDNNVTRLDDDQQQRPWFRPKVPYPEWNYNWDGRMTEKTSPESQSTIEGLKSSKGQPSNGTATTRHILLIRHGQYEMDPKDDQLRVLTPTGRRQAELTGQRLALLVRGGLGTNRGMLGPINTNDENCTDNKTSCYVGPCHVKAIHVSDMKRAKETSEIIASHLINADNKIKISHPDSNLNEALPTYVLPSRPDLVYPPVQIMEENQNRVEEAFQTYIYRALPEDYKDTENGIPPEHEFEVIVCHANIIRYFVCRALQVRNDKRIQMLKLLYHVLSLTNVFCSFPVATTRSMASNESI
jgi:serine/threonine-protein phosphatase PGAM5